MQPIRFRNKFLKNHTDENRYIYTKQSNLSVSQKKNQYFANFIEKDITDNIKFRHTVKPFFSERTKSRESVVIIIGCIN